MKYIEQYRENHSYHIGYKKAKNPGTYFRRYESQIILTAVQNVCLNRQASLKSFNVNKLKTKYEELTKQKKEVTVTYKNYEKEVHEQKQKLEKSLNIWNMTQYLLLQRYTNMMKEKVYKFLSILLIHNIAIFLIFAYTNIRKL